MATQALESGSAKVFTICKKKGRLKEMQVNRVVKAAATRVPGLEEAVADTYPRTGCVMLMQVTQWIAALRFT